MNHQEEDMDISLWAFVESRCSADEELDIRELIAADSSWKAAYDEILRTHAALTRSGPDQPSMRFAQNVMDAIGKAAPAAASRPYINIWIVRGIAATFIGLMIALLAVSISSLSWSHGATMLPKDMLAKATLFSKGFRPYFIMINIIGALALIDAVYHRRLKDDATVS